MNTFEFLEKIGKKGKNICRNSARFIVYALLGSGNDETGFYNSQARNNCLSG